MSDPSGFGGPGVQTFTYDLGTNAAGYNLTNLDTYSGWADDGRYAQAYTVLFATASNPTSFSTLETVNYQPGFGGNQAHVDLSGTAGGDLATNVVAPEFVFNPTANSNNYSVFQEITATGVAAPDEVAAVPEPSTWAMMFGGLGVLLAWNRRRQLSA